MFAQLLSDPAEPEAVASLAAMVRHEADIYRAHGLVTYMGDQCLLDIFTDTTERSPTFMLPRFRRIDDSASPAPWAFVKSPLHSTPDAWNHVLCRAPRCLDWNSFAYRRMDAPARLQSDPPHPAAADMLAFQIRNFGDPSRCAANPNCAILVALGDEVPRLHSATDPLWSAFADCSRSFDRRCLLAVSETGPQKARR